MFSALKLQWRAPLPRSMRYVPAMTALTAIYLATELGFNARLLDVTGGSPTHGQISSIEQCGRYISGVAVLLAVWGMVILPWAVPEEKSKPTRHRLWPATRWAFWRPATTIHAGPTAKVRPIWPLHWLAAALLISGIVCVSGVYKGERFLIDWLVNRSSGVERRTAAQLQAISVAVLNGSANIVGIDLTLDERHQPAAQAFLSIFPVIALSTPDLETRIRRILETAIRTTIQMRLGPPAHVHNTAYLPALEKFRSLYNDRYIAGIESHDQAIRDIPNQQEKYWGQYTSTLRSRNQNLTPYNVPIRRRKEVVDTVKGLGIDVPPSWVPSDRETFNEAIAEKIRRQADEAFDSQTRALAGTALPRDLDWPHFLALPELQRRLREQLDAPDTVVITGTMTPDQSEQQLYKPTVDYMTEQQVSVLMQPADSFGDGGINEVKGREAMEALLVKPIALGFSLLGALFHIFKTLRYLLQCALPRIGKLTKNLVVGIPVVAAILAVFAIPNPVSTSRGFGFLKQHTREAWGVWGTPGMVTFLWTIQAQPMFYPFNETVRRTVMLGQSYGYEPPDDSLLSTGRDAAAGGREL